MTMISVGTVAQNRKARFHYTILETLEAGLVLSGSEVKSLRGGKANIEQAYATQKAGQLYLSNATIAQTGAHAFFKHTASADRPLLLHKKEMNKLKALMAQKGYTIIPLELYFNSRGLAKVRLGLAQGKNYVDKRETIKQREWNREKHKILKESNR